MNAHQASNQATKMAQWIWSRGSERRASVDIAELRKVEPPFHNVDKTVRDLVALGWVRREGNELVILARMGFDFVGDGHESTWKKNAAREFRALSIRNRA